MCESVNVSLLHCWQTRDVRRDVVKRGFLVEMQRSWWGTPYENREAYFDGELEDGMRRELVDEEYGSRVRHLVR